MGQVAVKWNCEWGIRELGEGMNVDVRWLFLFLCY